MKKQKVNVNYPFTHRRKYHLLSGEKLYFISGMTGVEVSDMIQAQKEIDGQ